MIDPPLPGDARVDVESELARLGLTLEELDRFGPEHLDASPNDELDRALDAMLEPAPGFEARVTERAARRLRDRQSMLAFGGLLGLGWETARVIVEGDDDVRR